MGVRAPPPLREVETVGQSFRIISFKGAVLHFYLVVNVVTLIAYLLTMCSHIASLFFCCTQTISLMSRTARLRNTAFSNTLDINDKAVFTSVGIHIADYYSLRDALIAKRKSVLLTDTDKQDLIRQIQALQPLVSEAIEGGAGSFDALKKLIAQEQRIITQANKEKEMPFGEKAEALIYVITRAVMYQLQKMRSTDPTLYNRYVSGEETTFWLNTKTASLNTSLNRSELGADLVYADRKTKRESKKCSGLQSSLRGAKGLYAALMDTGFIIEKEVVNNNVKLCINLDWLFSLNALDNEAEKSSDIAETPSFSDSRSGLSTPLSQNVSTIVETKLTEYNESGVENLGSLLSSADFQQLVEPTNVGKKEKVEGEVEVSTSTVETATNVAKKEKVEAAPGAAGGAIAFDFAKDSANRALKLIFNKKICKMAGFASISNPFAKSSQPRISKILVTGCLKRTKIFESRAKVGQTWQSW
jgi:hypothetical protein